MSYKVYPVTKTDLVCNDYDVKINGEKVILNCARVSSMPFNRRWPGHQRDIAQTELINFLSLETDEVLNFEITPRNKFEKVTIRPLSLGISPEITDDGRILFTLKEPAYFSVEPYGRHDALHMFVDPVSKYNIDKNTENVLYYGKGEHDAGMIYIKSNQTLFLDEGAVVYGCVRATDAENIKILGRGILDNSKNKEEILFEANEENNFAAVNNAKRLHTIQLDYCENITIEGITIRDSLVYNIKPSGCKNIDISNVKIIGCWRYNSDGIDMHNCENVCIDNCFIRTFDDSICVKGFDFFFEDDVEKATMVAMYRNGKSYDIFKNVLVKNCVIWNDWGKCLEIGAETRAEEIFDITFDGCHIIHVTGPVLDCMNVDFADVHDVTYKNITVEYDDTIPPAMIQKTDNQKYKNTEPDFAPWLIRVEVCFHPEYSGGGQRRGKNRNITFDNIYLSGRQKPRMNFVGCNSEHLTENITVSNVYINDIPLAETDYELRENEYCRNIVIN